MKQIDSIRRDSDGEIFTIGDKIFDSLVKGGSTIIAFFDDEVGTLIVTSEGACTIDQAVKVSNASPFVVQLNKMRRMIDEILDKSNPPISPDVEKELAESKFHLESVYDYVISEE